MCLEEAVRVLQVCERARQGRLRHRFMKEIRQAEEEGSQAKSQTPISTLDPDQAATCIQKVRSVVYLLFRFSYVVRKLYFQYQAYISNFC